MTLRTGAKSVPRTRAFQPTASRNSIFSIHELNPFCSKGLIVYPDRRATSKFRLSTGVDLISLFPRLTPVFGKYTNAGACHVQNRWSRTLMSPAVLLGKPACGPLGPTGVKIEVTEAIFHATHFSLSTPSRAIGLSPQSLAYLSHSPT